MAGLSCQQDSDCHAVGFGSKPCGGPSEALIYSTQGLDEEAFLQQVEEFNRQEEEYNRRNEIVSDCMYVPLPDSLVCNLGQCQAADSAP